MTQMKYKKTAREMAIASADAMCIRLEFLRAQQCVEQVDTRYCANREHENRFSGHRASLQTITKVNIANRDGEESQSDGDKDRVLHPEPPGYNRTASLDYAVHKAGLNSL
jgi:hypothetical protein